MNAETPAPRRAVILVSGGLDSATVLAIAKDQGYECYALSFHYGQRHNHELQSAERLCKQLNVAKHVTIPLDFRQFGGSALTADIDVPKSLHPTEFSDDIPVTYVPARNTVFLSVALAWAETLGAFDIFIGVNAVDYSGYPDCRPAFIDAFEQLANLATKAGVEGESPFRIHSPLLMLKKWEIIRLGVSLGLDYGSTLTCYDPDSAGAACGQCDSCRLRLQGFEEAGLIDPAAYQPI